HLRVALSLLAPTSELAVCGDGTGVSAARADLSEGAARGRLWRLGTVAPAANGTSGINRAARIHARRDLLHRAEVGRHIGLAVVVPPPTAGPAVAVDGTAMTEAGGDVCNWAEPVGHGCLSIEVVTPTGELALDVDGTGMCSAGVQLHDRVEPVGHGRLRESIGTEATHLAAAREDTRVFIARAHLRHVVPRAQRFGRSKVVVRPAAHTAVFEQRAAVEVA